LPNATGGTALGMTAVKCRLKQRSKDWQVLVCDALQQARLDRDSRLHDDCPLDDTKSWSACPFYNHE
jgi:hypothetical protein